MHVMFIHPNFPAQFGQAAYYLSHELGWPCTFVTSVDTRHLNLPFNHINYRVRDDEPQSRVFHNPDSLQGLIDHLRPIYLGLRKLAQDAATQGHPPLVPDVVVGHMSYGTVLYLRNLYSCPFVGYFEMLPPPYWTEASVLRKEFPPPEGVRLFNATYHALTYLHLHMVDAMYTPTNYQRSTLPPEYQERCKVIYDGVDCEFFQRREPPRPLEFHGVPITPDTRIVTYVSPGLESVRGFDIFMKAAKKIAEQLPNVRFLIAGDARTAYGHEGHYLGQQSFKDWVLSQDNYDLSRFHFLGLIPAQDLATLFNLSDVHMYLTVPHIVSTSLVQALASECVVVGSNTAPVVEFIDDGVNGLLTGFYDVEGLAERAVRVLKDPAQFRGIGQAARARVLERYEIRHCLNELAAFFQSFQTRTRDDVFASLVPTP
jgi:glycosyltransferase involved in cell wall biosynthesis